MKPSCLAVIVLLAGIANAARPDGAAYYAHASADGVQRVTIVGGSHFFRPERIVAVALQPLELTLKSEPGLAPHRFVLEHPDGRRLADVKLGEAAQTLRFKLAAGDYAYYCPNRLPFFKSHREKGMAGVLEVRE